MTRQLAVFALLAVTSGATGCASSWETLSSRRFREKPFDAMFSTEDPVQVLRTNPDGETRARAMRRLKEPALKGNNEAEQDEVMKMLSDAATTDPSPWVRIAAIDTLARFQDPRTIEILATAYYQAGGRSASSPVIPVSTNPKPSSPGMPPDRLGLHGPQGFPADQAANIRGRAIDAIAKSGRPEAVDFLAQIATGQELPRDEDPSAQNLVRQRAVAGLGKIRTKEAVLALNQVFSTEYGKDVTITHIAHDGLVSLTGKKEPADPEAWNTIIQAGFEIAPEPGFVQRAIGRD